MSYAPNPLLKMAKIRATVKKRAILIIAGLFTPFYPFILDICNPTSSPTQILDTNFPKFATVDTSKFEISGCKNQENDFNWAILVNINFYWHLIHLH